MKTNNNCSIAFSEKEPSLFIVQTPFQAMCAINAIRQLKIENYELSLHLHPNTEKRNKQTIELADMYGLRYNVEKYKPIGFANLLGLLFKRRNRFNRVFLGTHLYHDGYYHALEELKDKGNLILLDDGVATLTLLKEGYNTKGKSTLFMAFYKVIAAIHRIRINNVLTVYKDIANPQWNIAFNDISLLRQTRCSRENSKIIFIGTNNSGFITRRGVDEIGFKKALFNVLKEVKIAHTHDEILYIPHGRDKSNFAKDFCDELGIKYTPIDINVEIYLITSGIIPNAIYGFTSSALYNLKRIFPESSIKNIVMKVLYDKSSGGFEISKYYEQQGIPTIRVGFDE